MMKFATVAALVLTTACAAQTQTPPYTDSRPYAPGYSGVDCDIRTTRTPHGLQFEAIAHADWSVQGDYDFVITAESSGGSSDIAQAGPLDLRAGYSDTVGYAEVPRGRYRAVLTLSDAHGELCRSERRS